MKASTSANMASAPTTRKFSPIWPGGQAFQTGRRPAFRCSSCEHAWVDAQASALFLSTRSRLARAVSRGGGSRALVSEARQPASDGRGR